MTYQYLRIAKNDTITTVTLNRPEKRNALHGPLISELLKVLEKMAVDETNILIINGAGEHFCAGADIAWMQKIAGGSINENYDDAQLLTDLVYQLYTFSKPTIVLAHGATMGGGLGLLAACDIAIAAENASFGFSEVKIGIAPSVVSPYVIAAIGERAAHYYFLTAEKFGAVEAQRIGLVHRVAKQDDLYNAGMRIAQTLQENSPKAMTAAKQLIRRVSKEKISKDLAQKTAEHLAELRATPDAQEGLNAFLEKRKAKWQ